MDDSKGGGFAFYLVLLALVFEFGRPQDVLLGLRAVPFPSIIDGLIALAVFLSGRFSLANLQTRLWLALLGLMLVHVPLATNNFWAAMTLKDMTLLFALFLGILAYLDSLQKIRTLVTVWLGIHLFLALFGVANKGSGVGGWLGDENDFCMEMNVAIPFAYFAFHSTKVKMHKILYVVLLGAFALAIMISLSRGGFIGLVVVGIYCWWRSSKKVGAILMIGILTIFMIIVAPGEYWGEVQSITSDQTAETGTGGERLYSWGIGWDMFLSNPIIGVGQANFPWNVGDIEAGKTFNERSIAGRQAHSAYFTLLPELGLVGVCIFSAFLYCLYRDMQLVRRIGKNLLGRAGSEKYNEDLIFAASLARAVEGSVVGYLASSVFISTLYYPSFWVLIAFGLVLRTATLKKFGSLDIEFSHGSQSQALSRSMPSFRSGRRVTGGTGPVVP